MKHIAVVHSPFPDKFGIPRQSGIVEELRSTVVFEREYRSGEAVRGLEDFSHIWLIWEFSEVPEGKWSPTVRPPRLGGNARKGVFATRSPFRPNPIGLSCVRLERIEHSADRGPILHISGADIMDGTPVYDIKPYIPYTDCRPDASSGFAPDAGTTLDVVIPGELSRVMDAQLAETLKKVLSKDPRPSYHDSNERFYGMNFGGFEIKFYVSENKLTVTEISKIR